METTQIAIISTLDPLHVDCEMEQVPAFNREVNLTALRTLLHSMSVRFHDRVGALNDNELHASIRDLGIIFGSLRRHGVEPLQDMPELEADLLTVSGRLNMPPRDTVLHYAVLNPEGARQRRYSDHPAEPDLIKSIALAFPGISSALNVLADLYSCDLEQLESPVAEQVEDGLRSFIHGLEHAIKEVKPKYFIEEFRPYFEPIDVKGVAYRGPGAVTLPLHIFDFVLWGSSEPSARYQAFTADYVQYTIPTTRALYQKMNGQPSYLDLVQRRHAAHPFSVAAIHQLKTWFQLLVAFRHAHLRYAFGAYHGKIKHRFKTGSGGHTVDDLTYLSGLTEAKLQLVETLEETAAGGP